MIVAAYNPATDDLDKTYVSSYMQKNAVTLPVKNNTGFVSNTPILIGAMGGETAEMSVPSAVSADRFSLTVPALQFDHNTDDPVYLMDFDRVRFYRATSVNGTYLLVATVPIEVNNEDKVTTWDDVNSDPTVFYKTSFYNSITHDETVFSDAVAATGYDITTIGDVIDRAVRRVRDREYLVLGIDEYLDIAQEVGDDLITQAQKPYVFLKRKIVVDISPGDSSIPMPDNFWKFDYVEILTSAAGYQRYDREDLMNLSEFNDRYNNNQGLSQDNILQLAFDDVTDELLFYPTAKSNITAAVILHYYKVFDNITSVGNVIETPNATIYKYKFMAEHYSAKSEADKSWFNLSTKYEAKYAAEIGKMQRVNRKDVGSPRAFAPPKGFRRRRRYHL